MGDWYTIGLALGLGTALGRALRRAARRTTRRRPHRGDRARRRRGSRRRLVDRGLDRDRRGRASAASSAPRRPRSWSSGALPARRYAWRARADRRRRLRRARRVSPSCPSSAISPRRRCPVSPRGCGAHRPSGTRACAALPETERTKLILVIIDGLTPSMLEDAVERRAAPSLALLAEHGRYRRAVSTFPSLTPVCLSSLATGAHPDVHEIPHLVWYHREERRLVEYGSSFGAIRAAGTRQALVDTIYGLNDSHLGAGAVTVYEALEDAGLTAAAVNVTCYRGPVRAPAHGSVPDPARARPESLLLLQPVRVGRDRGAARRAQPAARARSTPTPRRSAAGS